MTFQPPDGAHRGGVLGVCPLLLISDVLAKGRLSLEVTQELKELQRQVNLFIAVGLSLEVKRTNLDGAFYNQVPILHELVSL